MISSILGSLMGGGTDFFGRSMNDTLDMDATVSYLEANRFDADLVWVNGSDGVPEMQLTSKQWSLVQDLELNVFYDDGEGFIDLGMDNIFSFKDNNALVGLYDGAWLSIDIDEVRADARELRDWARVGCDAVPADGESIEIYASVGWDYVYVPIRVVP